MLFRIERLGTRQWRAHIYRSARGWALWRVTVGSWQDIDRVISVSALEITVPA